MSGASAVAAVPAALSRARRMWRRYGLAAIGAAIVLAWILVALLAPWIAPWPPNAVDVTNRLLPPSGAHWLGTDALGRDVFSRLLWGAQVSLLAGFTVVLIGAALGTLVGAVAAYARGWADEALMRVTDLVLCFPPIILALAIAAALGPSALNAVIALAVVYAPRTARIVRAQVLVVREMEYVTAARASGAGDAWIVARHVLPNSMAPLIVQLTFIFAYAVLAESILSFLGVGPPPPTPTWGNMIAEGKDTVREAWWIALFPGTAIAATVLGLNMLGDGLRDVLDPRLKVQQG